MSYVQPYGDHECRFHASNLATNLKSDLLWRLTKLLTYSNMPPPYDDESDFDSDEEFSEVQLGLADGPLENEDEANPLVSRIGGRPVWLPLSPTKLPPASLVQCQYCQKPMQLLVQIFAPLENSAFDRNLFVWGCARAACQRKGPGRYVSMGALEDDVKFLHLMRCACFYEKNIDFDYF